MQHYDFLTKFDCTFSDLYPHIFEDAVFYLSNLLAMFTGSSILYIFDNQGSNVQKDTIADYFRHSLAQLHLDK